MTTLKKILELLGLKIISIFSNAKTHLVKYFIVVM